MFKYTERKTVPKLMHVQDIEAQFLHALDSTGDVALAPRLKACIPEIKIRILNAQLLNQHKNTLEYERYACALQKFVRNFVIEIENRAKNGVSLKRPTKHVDKTVPVQESSVPLHQKETKKQRNRNKMKAGRFRGFFDDDY